MYINLRTTAAKPDNENFRFEIGETVSHQDGSLIGEVIARCPAARIGDVYEVLWTHGNLAGTFHIMMGRVLQPAESATDPAPAVAQVALVA